MVTFDKLVDDIHRAHLAFGRAEVSREDVGDIVRATIVSLGLHVSETTGEVYDPAPKAVINYPNDAKSRVRARRRR